MKSFVNNHIDAHHVIVLLGFLHRLNINAGVGYTTPPIELKSGGKGFVKFIGRNNKR